MISSNPWPASVHSYNCDYGFEILIVGILAVHMDQPMGKEQEQKRLAVTCQRLDNFFQPKRSEKRDKQFINQHMAFRTL